MPYKDNVLRKANFRKWYSVPENKAEWKRQKQVLNEKYKNEAFALLGEVCVECGFSDRRALQMDHVNGDGHKDKERGHCGYTVYRRVLKNPERFQILCANHNWIKRVERKECPQIEIPGGQ